MNQPAWADYTAPQKITVGDVDVAYRRKGAGEPLLFLHGEGLTRRWLPLYERLSASFDVIVPEHLGFGDTPLPDWAGGFDDLLLHYAELLDLLGLGSVHLVGFSFGGWLAAEFATFYPERVMTLTLIAPTGLRPDASEAMPDAFRMTPPEHAMASLGADAERWREYLDEGDPGAQMIMNYQEATGLARFTWNPRYDLRLERRLRRVSSPSLVLVPEHDGLVAPSVGRRYAELLPDAELVTLSGDVPTEHLVVLQEPDQIADRVATLRSRA